MNRTEDYEAHEVLILHDNQIVVDGHIERPPLPPAQQAYMELIAMNEARLEAEREARSLKFWAWAWFYVSAVLTAGVVALVIVRPW